MRDLGRLRRSRTDRKVAGVSGGLGRHFDVDPTIIRVAFVVLAFFGGAGLLLYGVGWLLVPEEGDERARVHLEPSTRSIVLIAFTVIAALMMVGDSGGFFDFPWPLAVLGVVVLSIMMSRKDRGRWPGLPDEGRAGHRRADHRQHAEHADPALASRRGSRSGHRLRRLPSPTAAPVCSGRRSP